MHKLVEHRWQLVVNRDFRVRMRSIRVRTFQAAAFPCQLSIYLEVFVRQHRRLRLCSEIKMKLD